jgi:Chalcone isomerase-like
MLTVRSSLIRKFAPALVGCWLASSAAAATLAGMTLPDTYTVDGRTLVLNGIGVRTLTIFAIRAYVAGLYLTQPSHDATQILASNDPKVLILKFVHGASKQRVENHYRAGEANNCRDGACDPSDKSDFERLVAAAPAVKPGDTTTYIFTGPHVRVLANDRLIDEFTNQDLAFHLLAGFIGAHPPSQKLRRQLLGLPAE